MFRYEIIKYNFNFGVYRIINISAVLSSDDPNCIDFTTNSDINPDEIFMRFMNFFIQDCKSIEFGNVNVFGKDVKSDKNDFDAIKLKSQNKSLQQLASRKDKKSSISGLGSDEIKKKSKW